MNWLWRLVFLWLREQAKRGFLREARRQGVLIYLRVLHTARHGLMAAVAVLLFFQLMIMTLCGAVVSALWLWDTDPQTRLMVLFGICSALFTLSVAALTALFSQKLWYKASGAQDMVENLRASD